MTKRNTTAASNWASCKFASIPASRGTQLGKRVRPQSREAAKISHPIIETSVSPYAPGQCVFHVTVTAGADGVSDTVTDSVVVNGGSSRLTGINTVTASASGARDRFRECFPTTAACPRLLDNGQKDVIQAATHSVGSSLVLNGFASFQVTRAL
jgi:hypothetical protein